MRTELTDYGFHFNYIPIYYDSKSTIAISCNPVQHSRTKHIAVRYHFIKEHVEKGTIELYFVKTDYQLADHFTKALPVDRFNYLVRRLGMRSLSPPELERLGKSRGLFGNSENSQRVINDFLDTLIDFFKWFYGSSWQCPKTDQLLSLKEVRGVGNWGLGPWLGCARRCGECWLCVGVVCRNGWWWVLRWVVSGVVVGEVSVGVAGLDGERVVGWGVPLGWGVWVRGLVGCGGVVAGGGVVMVVACPGSTAVRVGGGGAVCRYGGYMGWVAVWVRSVGGIGILVCGVVVLVGGRMGWGGVFVSRNGWGLRVVVGDLGLAANVRKETSGARRRRERRRSCGVLACGGGICAGIGEWAEEGFLRSSTPVLCGRMREFAYLEFAAHGATAGRRRKGRSRGCGPPRRDDVVGGICESANTIFPRNRKRDAARKSGGGAGTRVTAGF
ncbi:hypothetical protein Tco_1291737 [Tanacetum coccineum]